MFSRGLLFLLIPGVVCAQVSFDRILGAAAEPQNWLTYSGSTMSQRHSPLTQITRDNVKNLELKWIWQSRTVDKFEATALVVDGVLYTVQNPNGVVALNATTGKVLWTSSYAAKDSRPTARHSRGLAILGDTLFLGTTDAHVIALAAKDGAQLWNTEVAKAASGYYISHAPLVVKDKVIVGTAGGEYGIRGFIAAYDAKTGKRAWRFNTIPGPGEPGNETWIGDTWMHGGGSVWNTGSYDPDANLTYWGVGNPGPDWNGDLRPGDNLYTCSVVALDPDTGKLKWYYQFSPHDEFDFDSVQVPVLANMDWQGRPRKVMLWGNRNGVFYVLDRNTGQFLLGKPFVKVTWMNGFDEKGRPMKVPGMTPSEKGTQIYPGNQGGTNWYPPSFSPSTGLFYVQAWDNYYSTFVKGEKGGTEYAEGKMYLGGMATSVMPFARDAQSPAPQPEAYGAIRAIDPKTGEKKWDFKLSSVSEAGILTTASDLLFSAGRDGDFLALDARNGSLLWKATLGSYVNSGPMSYSVGGRQYIAVTSGSSLFSFALRQ
jgi:alcohol dehydrogenase (cytochrome c)